MVLQRVLLPQVNDEAINSLYFRTDSGVFSDGKIFSEKGGICSFNTYYGSFSFSKWHKYTLIDKAELHVVLNGEFLIKLYNTDTDGKDMLLCEKKINGSATIPFDNGNIIWFSVECMSDKGIFEEAYFVSDDLKESDKKEITLAAVICTYRRENFVERNLSELEKNIINNPLSSLYGKFSLTVCDNGHTLKERRDNGITVLHNKNAGGAGGFARGMIEVYERQKTETVSHILLMDDDVKFETESIERTAAFFSIIKPEYEDAFIGGAMFRTDDPIIQNEMANRWENNNVKALKRFKNMTVWENVVRNENEEDINYFSWWYCCMPTNIIREDNLPMPVFIKRDDIEYGLRNGKHFITLNGINVWHEPFENKRPAFLEYYYIRNQLIMEAFLNSAFDAVKLKKKLFKQMKTDIFTFRYLESEIRFEGVRDFLKGASFLKETDPEELNAKIIGMGRKLKPIEEFDVKPDMREYEFNKKPKESKIRKLVRKATLNGWLLPSFKTVTLPAAFPKPTSCFMKKRALNYDESSDKAFVTEKSVKKAVACVRNYFKLCKEIDGSFESARESYIENKNILIGMEFWKKYHNLGE